MAGKKGSKTDARTPTRSNGASDRSILDQARAITAVGCDTCSHDKLSY